MTFEAATMHHSFSPTMVRPNLPLRKPSSSPMSLSTPRPPAPPNPLPVPEAIVRTQSDAIGDGKSRPTLSDMRAMLDMFVFLI